PFGGAVVLAEQLRRLIEQGNVGRGPLLSRVPQEQLPLFLGEARGGAGEPLRGAEEVGQELLRSEDGPQLIQYGAHRRIVTQLTADLGDVGFVEEVSAAERVLADAVRELLGERMHDLDVEDGPGEVVRPPG